MPATGFALGVDRIILALRREGALQGKEAWDDYVAFSAKGETKAIIKAMTLRCKGRKSRWQPVLWIKAKRRHAVSSRKP